MITNISYIIDTLELLLSVNKSYNALKILIQHEQYIRALSILHNIYCTIIIYCNELQCIYTIKNGLPKLYNTIITICNTKLIHLLLYNSDNNNKIIDIVSCSKPLEYELKGKINKLCILLLSIVSLDVALNSIRSESRVIIDTIITIHTNDTLHGKDTLISERINKKKINTNKLLLLYLQSISHDEFISFLSSLLHIISNFI